MEFSDSNMIAAIAFMSITNYLSHYEVEHATASLDTVGSPNEIEDACKKIGELTSKTLLAISQTLIAWKKGEMSFGEMLEKAMFETDYFTEKILNSSDDFKHIYDEVYDRVPPPQ